MRRAILMCAALSMEGCFGSFRLVNAVYDFNRDLSDNLVVQEVVFLAFAVVQVYSIAAVGDAIVFNTLEAITGDNPLAETPPESRVATLPDGRTIAVIEDGDGVLVAVEGQRAKRLVRKGKAIAVVEDGQLLARIEEVNGRTHMTTADGVEVDLGIDELLASWQQ